MKTKNFITVPRPIFVNKRAKGQYIFDETDMSDVLYEGQNIYLPLVIDTEFWYTMLKQHLANINGLNYPFRGREITLKIPGHYKKGRFGVTTQVRGIHEKEGCILVHRDLLNVAKQIGEEVRHPVANSGFHPVDYLQSLGINAELYRNPEGKINTKFRGEVMPSMTIICYGFFLPAEYGMIGEDEYKQDLIKIALSKKGGQLDMRRRLNAFTENKHSGRTDSVELPWYIKIEDFRYRVKIVLIDACAIHGVASYRDFCETTGVALSSKDLMKDHITRMHLAYFEHPEEFDSYALGDLEVYKALANNAKLFKQVWESLGIGEYYTPPALTIGSAVKAMYEAKLYKLFKISPDDKESQKELLDKVCKKGTAEYLKYFTNSTQCKNSKVDGGRCRNNQPTTTFKDGVIADIDISGCYGEGQRNQLYALGSPIIEDFDYPSKLNKYLSLREWRKIRKWGKKDCELIPGLWQARVCTKETWEKDKPIYAQLEIPQDFLTSWYGFKMSDISSMPTDTDLQDASEECLEVKTGTTKILNHQVINGIITHDFFDWLDNVCNPTQRNELLDGLFVHTSMYYPAYDRVDSPEELLERIAQHEGVNTTESGKRKGGSRKTKITEECTAWYGVNLGEFIIDDLLAYRKIHPKKNLDGSKNSLNTLYKLCINTLYGDMVSPYFKISNVVVGNNITARARAACYYTEKGLNGFMSITDGTAFDLNKVTYPVKNRSITSQAVVNLYREKDPVAKKNIKLAPLDDCEKIHLTWQEIFVKNEKTGKDEQEFLPSLTLHKNGEITTLKPYEEYDPIKKVNYWVSPANTWLDKKALEHLQKLFNVDVLQAKTTRLKVTNDNGTPIKKHISRIGQFEYETKAFYKAITAHGASNYYLQGEHEKDDNMAARSYEKKTKHHTVWRDEDTDNIHLTSYLNNQTPAAYFFHQLSDPCKVKRSKTFLKPGILKLNDFKKNFTKYQSIGREFGDTIDKTGLLREFSLSQFTFQTKEQLENIQREMNANKRKYCQSYEGYFINNDGTLNFQQMIIEVDKAISEGAHSFNKVFDKSRHRHRIQDMYHPEQKTLGTIRQLIAKPITEDEAKPITEDDADFLDDNHIFVDEDGYMHDVDDNYTHCVSGEYVDDPSLLDDFEYIPLD